MERNMKEYVKMQTFVKVKASFIGFHSWPEAPESVGFLKNAHRHIFYVTLKVPVESHDREVEFFILQDELFDFIKEKMGYLGSKSCEMIASEIAGHFIDSFDFVEVEVSEDNENSAIVVMEKQDEDIFSR
jgi:hypothetical protein